MGFFLKYHIKHGKTGLIDNGLCNDFKDAGSIKSYEIFQTLCPTEEDLDELVDSDSDTTYWGSGVVLPVPDDNPNWLEEIATIYTPLRQTIVLFCAALNNEL